MGQFGNAPRGLIVRTFDGSCGDRQGDVEPAFIEWRNTHATAIEADLRKQGSTLEVRYRILDDALDDDDAKRIFLFAYLDVFARHAWRNANVGRFPSDSLKLSFVNEASGAASETPYPDPE
jgi:hypothetical protein